MKQKLMVVLLVLCLSVLTFAQSGGAPLSVVVTDNNGNALTITGATILTDAQRRAAGILIQHPQSVVLTDINGNPLQLATIVVSLQPSYPESYTSWTPGTLYPQTLTGTCVFAAATTCTVTYPTTFASTPIVQITPVNPGAVTFTVTTSSTTQIIITASGSNSLTVNYSAALPSGINCSTNTFSLTGARQNLDFVVPEWPSALPLNLSKEMWVSSSDTIKIQLCNQSGVAVTFSTSLAFGAKLFR